MVYITIIISRMTSYQHENPSEYQFSINYMEALIVHMYVRCVFTEVVHACAPVQYCWTSKTLVVYGVNIRSNGAIMRMRLLYPSYLIDA